MSDYEYHIGRLKRHDEVTDTESFFKYLCLQVADKEKAEKYYKWEDDSWYGAYKSLYCDWNYILGRDGKVYEIIEDNRSDDCECTTVTDVGNGEYMFVSNFYNGGTCLYDCLENALFEEN
jgi:hypothetical protein